MRLLPALACLLFAAFFPAFLTAATPSAPDLRALRPHPRLLVTPDTWQQIRDRAAADPAYRVLVDQVITTARARLETPPPTRTLTGKRLLFVSRRVLTDAIWLSLAYHLTGEKPFLEIAERNLAAAAAFPDWNPSHFLDVAEMSAALALGYDWLRDDLSPAARTALRDALVEKGIRPALDPESRDNWWHTRKMNWNQVCLGGLTLAALAVADEKPDLARQALDLLARHHANGLVPYGPDGIYPEGPNYWRYGTSYTVLPLAALQTALGSEAPFTNLDAFFAGARVQARLIAPSGEPFAYGDTGPGAAPDPLLFWFAHRLGDPDLLADQGRHYHPYVPPSKPTALDWENIFVLLHWQTPPPPGHTTWSAWMGGGQVPIAVFRGPDTPRGAFYLAVKGGSPRDSHAHMDGGSFALELDGVRWADDIGGQNYTKLEALGIKLFDSRAGGDRWKIFRHANLSHNTLALDDTPHIVEARAALLDFSADPAALSVTADLKSTLSPKLDYALRRFRPRPDGLGLEVTDTLAGLKPGSTVTWTLVTRAEIALDGTAATLTRDGRRLAITAPDAPPGIRAEIASATGPADFDAPAPAHRILRYRIPVPADGRLLLQVRFSAMPLGQSTP